MLAWINKLKGFIILPFCKSSNLSNSNLATKKKGIFSLKTEGFTQALILYEKLCNKIRLPQKAQNTSYLTEVSRLYLLSQDYLKFKRFGYFLIIMSYVAVVKYLIHLSNNIIVSQFSQFSFFGSIWCIELRSTVQLLKQNEKITNSSYIDLV